jgi:hypothetical protein
MKSVAEIVGCEQLLAVFGYWPSFHDAEVHWVRLDRASPGDGMPSVEAVVHAFEMTSEIDANGYYVLRHHVLVHFRFHEIVDLRIEEMNNQNALFGLQILDIRDRQLERVKFEVHFDPSFGMYATFGCFSVEVLSVQACDRSGNLIPA